MSPLLLPSTQALSPVVKLLHVPPGSGHVLFINPVTHSPHSTLPSHIEPCRSQELQAQGCLLSVCCTACFISLWTAIISHPLPPLSFCTLCFNLVADFSASPASLLPNQKAIRHFQPWQCLQKNLITILRSTLNHFWRALCGSLPVPTHVLVNAFLTR